MQGHYANGSALMEALICPTNEIRTTAENYVNALKASQPEVLFNYCFESLTNANAAIVQMGLFLIKKEFVVEKDLVPAHLRSQLGETILKIVQSTGSKVLMNISADIICGMAASTKDYKGFLEKLVTFCQSPDSKMRMFGLIAFESMTAAHLETEVVESYANNFLAIFTALLKDAEVQVRMQAVKTTTTFLSNIENADLIMKMGSVLNNLVSTMIEALNYDEDQGKSALESLTNLTDMQPDIWSKYLSDIVIVCSQIITATKFKEETRSEAIELIMAIADAKKSEIRKLAEIKTMFFPALLQMMTELDHKDNIEAWTNDEENEITKIDPASSAATAVSRIAEIMGSKATIALTDTHIASFMKSADWTQRYAGVLCLGIVSEYCKEIMSKDVHMKQVLKYFY